MKRYLVYLFSVLIAFSVYSCGGAGQTTESVPTQTNSYPLTTNTLAFDFTDASNPIVPFPNDLLLVSTTTTTGTTALSASESTLGETTTTKSIYVPTSGVTDPAALAFYTAINKLQLGGLSPNTPITIPLATSTIQLNEAQLQSNVKAIDVTKALTGSQDIFAPLIVKQNGNVINAYPAVPFNYGDQYVVVVTNGIDNLQSSSIAQSLMGDTKLTGNMAALEPLREAYVKLLPLIQALGIPKSNILEMFTFKVASKTLSLMTDYSQIGAAAQGKISPDSMEIQGYKYSDLDNMTYAGTSSKNEYLKIDGLSDLPLICQNLYDNVTIRNAYNLPKITDNLTTYMLTPNVYALSDIQAVLYKYDFPDNQTNYPLVCANIFDNATLYDNVTTAVYFGGNKIDNASEISQSIQNGISPKGIIMFQHGLGKDKSDAGTLSSSTDLNNYLFYAMDLPWHGDRIPPNPMFNYMEDECKASGSCYLTSNPINDVMNIYQSLLDMHTFEKFIYAGDVELATALSSEYNTPIPPLPLYFLSQSMGSITGSMLLNIDNITTSEVLGTLTTQLHDVDSYIPDNKTSSYISKAVLNVGGANYSAILNDATNPEIMGLLCSALKMPTSECTPDNVAKYKNTVKYNMTIALFQLVLDPVDPEFFARNPSIKGKILMQSAYHDTLVPNSSNEILYNDYNTPGFPYVRLTPTDILCDASNPLAVAGWYMFKGQAPYDWINHGFLVHTADSIDKLNQMYQSAAGHMSLECVNSAEELSRQQANYFFTPSD